MPKASIKRADNNPWPQWPKVYMMDYGQEEAAELQGEDPRVYETMTKKFVGDKEGNVKEAHTVQIEWVKDENGRMSPNEIPGTEKVLKADLVFLAMGFLGPEHLISEQLGIKLDQKSNYEADFGEYTTSIEGVFAAGDCRRGQSLIVWAISEGRQAAKACDKFLMGSTQLP
jgi:glutamate synthase (NADPH/NADH) small chain